MGRSGRNKPPAQIPMKLGSYGPLCVILLSMEIKDSEESWGILIPKRALHTHGFLLSQRCSQNRPSFFQQMFLTHRRPTQCFITFIPCFLQVFYICWFQIRHTQLFSLNSVFLSLENRQNHKQNISIQTFSPLLFFLSLFHFCWPSCCCFNCFYIFIFTLSFIVHQCG